MTDQIVRAIESGGVDKWKQPWINTGKCVTTPLNVVSRKAYRGINIVSLWADASAKNFPTGEWGTFKQWLSMDCPVKKGEKASYAVFWKFGRVMDKDEDPDSPEEEGEGKSKLLMTRDYAVFNAAQVDGYEPEDNELPLKERIAEADVFFERIPSIVRHGGDRACYNPTSDRIQLPKFEQFETPHHYYSTNAHEHAHWSGSKSRLDRDLTGRFGTNAYAMEELVAELTAAFVMANLTLENTPREDHAQYIHSWLKVLKADSRAIFTAASSAQKAADYLIEAARAKEVAA